MKTETGDSLCPQTPLLFKLDKRCTLLEAEFTHVRETVTDTAIKVDQIQTHIAKQNGALPRLERGMAELISKLQNEEIKKVEGKTKINLTWILVVASATAILGVVLGKLL